ncbi:hypothetical protein ACGH2B_28590 [Streptomyces sp. BBFR2]|uniref:hypothetical protein n=1 Tax=Streptomyces sp. BBFR2 TaxID=3372854 RepID=UPI0037DA0FA6
MHLIRCRRVLGRHADAVHRPGEVIALPDGRPGVARDIAEGVLLLNFFGTPSDPAGDAPRERHAELRALTDRRGSRPGLPGSGRALLASGPASLEGGGAPRAVLQALTCADPRCATERARSRGPGRGRG